MGWCIFHRAGLAFCCRSRLSSNVRHHTKPALPRHRKAAELMPITSRRKGHRAKNRAEGHRRFALSRLRAKWKKMTKDEMETHLRLLAIAEKNCMPHRVRRPEAPLNRWLQPRLRSRRLEVARWLIRIGGRVNACLLARVLPRSAEWPGTLALVGGRAINLAPCCDA